MTNQTNQTKQEEQRDREQQTDMLVEAIQKLTATSTADEIQKISNQVDAAMNAGNDGAWEYLADTITKRVILNLSQRADQRKTNKAVVKATDGKNVLFDNYWKEDIGGDDQWIVRLLTDQYMSKSMIIAHTWTEKKLLQEIATALKIGQEAIAKATKPTKVKKVK